METIRLEEIRPAEYNPRELSENAFGLLKKSISELGILKPIIVNKENGVIIAGHQRTKAMLALGIKECPAFIINGINTADEMRFNQLHNSCEYEISDKAPNVKITKENLSPGYQHIKPQEIQIIDNGWASVLDNNLCTLIMKYGDFAAPIVKTDGEVIVSSAYAKACKLTGHDMWCIVVDGAKEDKIKNYFAATYGEFSYDNIPRTTYHQHFAQMKRLRTGKKDIKNSMRSTLYERLVIPYIKQFPKSRILDFGCGEGDYVKLLGKNFDIIGVDPYKVIKGKTRIDINGNKNDFMRVCKEISGKGFFDVVVCDSVLNSVDSEQAEKDVINTCKALCKKGGIIFMSGRTLEFSEERNKMNLKENTNCYVSHFDKNKFSAIYRNGNWFFQHFHDEEMRKRIANILGGNSEIFVFHDRKSNFSIKAENNGISEEDAISSLMREFNMQLPNGNYGMGEEIRMAYIKAKEHEKRGHLNL